ncbi:MAG: filamentous hemagglutinin N-terminal domain-containing protein [Cyanobacteria bacterium P01_F01_bin.116]
MLRFGFPVYALALWSLMSVPLVYAQIIPDQTLGSETSNLITDQLVNDEPSDLIEGGAIRGSNLFHSFREFNVPDGGQVYFANPVEIDSILSRVTGNNPSSIFGTLGVDGTADLFLINPNGIIFGVNALLDVEGSFYATTAEGVKVGSSIFSATTPEQGQLLSVSPSTSFWHYLTEQSGDIFNQGQLAVGRDLTLAGHNLDLQGQMAAAGNVSLLATDTLRIRDTAVIPFVVLSGGDLLVQGDQQVDIVALSHADSGLFAYGDMTLRSAAPIGGDAHYWSGGNFRVESLDGSGGELFSPIDPIVRAFGNVEIEDYQGSSLHILAGGAVTLGSVTIREADPGIVDIDFLQEDIQLSDGTVVSIDGGARPTLDVRAGVSPEIIGSPPLTILTGFDPLTDRFLGDAFVTNIPANANIILESASTTADGLVLLTNNYGTGLTPLEGTIRIESDSFSADGIDVGNLSGQGGSVFLDSRSDIDVINSIIRTSAIGDVGDIVIIADGTVTFDGSDEFRAAEASSDILFGGEGIGGDVRITAANLNVVNNARLNSRLLGDGAGGNIILDIRDMARFDGGNPVFGASTGAFGSIARNGEGTAGNVQIMAENLEVLNGAELVSSTFGDGQAGNVILDISETARFQDVERRDGSFSGAFSRIASGGEGQGGDIQINAGNLEVLGGAQISSSTFGLGDAGDVTLNIVGLVLLEGSANVVGTRTLGTPSGAFSSVARNGIGQGGTVQVTAGNLTVSNGATISTTSRGIGDSGTVILDIDQLARFEGSNPVDGSRSGVLSRIEQLGQGGNIQITAGNLEVLDGAQLTTSIFGVGTAGDVILNVAETARFAGGDPIDGSLSGAFSSIQRGGRGNGGNVQVTANNLEVLDGAVLSASTNGQGNAGNVILEIGETARFDGETVDGRPSGAASKVEFNGNGTGGDVRIVANNLEVLKGATLSTSTSGVGDAGDVILEVAETARFTGINSVTGDSGGAFSTVERQGQGGDVRVTANNLVVLDGAQLLSNSFGLGNAGNVILNIGETARFDGLNPIAGIPSAASSSLDFFGVGESGDVRINAANLEVTNGAQISSGTSSIGNGGNVVINVSDRIRLEGIAADFDSPSGISSGIEPGGLGQGGNVEITAGSVDVLNGAVIVSEIERFGNGPGGDVLLVVREDLTAVGGRISSATLGRGDAGDVIIDVGETARFQGTEFVTGAFGDVEPGAVGQGGDVRITATNLEVLDSAQLVTGTLGRGDAGDVVLEIGETARFAGESSGAFSSVAAFIGQGNSGDIGVTATNLFLGAGAGLVANSFGQGEAGDIVLTIGDRIQSQDGTIATNAEFSTGGQINIAAGTILLFGDSDIQTFVNSGIDNGGDITIRSNAVVALDDSDILAFAADGRGGDVDLSQTAFFGQSFEFAPSGTDPRTLDNNARVDINASGNLASGTILLTDVSFIENNLRELPETLVDIETLVSSSCIAHSDDNATGRFSITASDGLPQQVDSSQVIYSLSSVQPIPENEPSALITEPTNIYRLADGRLIMGQRCDG